MAEHGLAGHRPDFESLSAWLDGELDEAAQRQLEAHLASCPACAAEADALRELAAAFVPMRDERLGCDLAGVIDARLASTGGKPVEPRRRPSPARGWLIRLPLAFGVAAALALAFGVGIGLSLGLGSALPGAGGAQPTLVGALHVFDALPPGSLCGGTAACYAKGMTK